MKNNEYRLNVRFDLTDEREKRIADYLRSLNKGTCGTINAFMIQAAERQIEATEHPKSSVFTLDDIRMVVREELEGAAFAAPFAVPTAAEQNTAAEDDSIAEALTMFGCCQTE